jgi:(p)ppGpp synthase/HD superfamily hydrolase
MTDLKKLNIEFEAGVRMLSSRMPVSDEGTRKPKLFHDIRVGTYLYTNGYSRDIVLAGLLHDALEFTDIGAEEIRDGYGDEVLRLVRASTKDDSIADGREKTRELISRCVSAGEDALIVKAADILDSFAFYAAVENQGELGYCMRNADAIFASKPDAFDDRIFSELKVWQERYVDIPR